MSTETAVATTGSTGVQKREVKTIKELVAGDAFKEQVAMALPKHLTPERFIRVALTAFNRTPGLLQCTQQSLFQCLLDLSALGIEPDGRRAHLIPYRDNKSGTTVCQLLIDFKGLAELVLRSGDVSYIHADVVCENDQFEYNMGQITKHVIDFKKPRGEKYAAYAVAKMKSGDMACKVLSREDIERVRRASKCGNFGPWVNWPDAMWMKTAFRNLSKWLPLSPEIREQVEKDDKYQFKFEAEHPTHEKTPLESAKERAELMGIDASGCKTAKEVDELIAAMSAVVETVAVEDDPQDSPSADEGESQDVNDEPAAEKPQATKPTEKPKSKLKSSTPSSASFA